MFVGMHLQPVIGAPFTFKGEQETSCVAPPAVTETVAVFGPDAPYFVVAVFEPVADSGVPSGKVHAKLAFIISVGSNPDPCVLKVNVHVAGEFSSTDDAPGAHVPYCPAGTFTSDEEDSTTTGATDDELCWPMGPLEEKLLKKSLEEDEDTGGGFPSEDSGVGAADDSIWIAEPCAFAISFSHMTSAAQFFLASATWLAKSIDCVSSIALT
jgi:hypothetical protein